MKTPDPIQTTEALAAAVAALASELLVLFQFDIGPERKSALSTIILLAFTVGAFLHGAWVRGKRTEVVAAEKYAAGGTVATTEPAPLVHGTPPAA
jgi:hypothetical protein